MTTSERKRAVGYAVKLACAAMRASGNVVTRDDLDEAYGMVLSLMGARGEGGGEGAAERSGAPSGWLGVEDEDDEDDEEEASGA